MEKLIVLLEKEIASIKDAVFERPEFDSIKHARRIGTIEGLGKAIDILRQERKAYDED